MTESCDNRKLAVTGPGGDGRGGKEGPVEDDLSSDFFGGVYDDQEDEVGRDDFEREDDPEEEPDECLGERDE